MSPFSQTQSQARTMKFKCALLSAVASFAIFCILPIARPLTSNVQEEFFLTEVFSSDAYNASSSPSANILPIPAFNADSRPAFAVSEKFETSKIDIDVNASEFANTGFAIGEISFAAAQFANTAENGDGLEIGIGRGLETGIFELAELDKVPQLRRKANIKYPDSLLKRGIEGEVRLLVIIDEGGRIEVENVESSSDKLFTQSALEAVKKLLYETPLKNGRPVRAKFILPIPFKISR